MQPDQVSHHINLFEQKHKANLNRWEDALQRPRSAHLYVAVWQMKCVNIGMHRERTKGGAMPLDGTEFQRLLCSHKDKHFEEKSAASGNQVNSSVVLQVPTDNKHQRGKLFVCVNWTKC